MFSAPRCGLAPSHAPALDGRTLQGREPMSFSSLSEKSADVLLFVATLSSQRQLAGFAHRTRYRGATAGIYVITAQRLPGFTVLGPVWIQDSHPGLVMIQALDGPIRFD